MSKKIKAVDIADEVTNEEAKIEEPKVEEIVEEKPTEETTIGEPIKETSPKSDDEVKITEIIKEEAEKPKPNRKMVTCPDCGKTMLEKNFRYQHINVCGKVKVPKLRAKPIDEVIKEKREKSKVETSSSSSVETKPKVEASPSLKVELKEKPPEELPLPKPTYWEIRKQYNNHLKEQKQQLVKRLVSKAF